MLGEIRTDSKATDWTGRVRHAGLELYRVFIAHRWAAAQMILSSDRGPNTLRLWEFVGQEFSRAGFTTQQGFDGLSLILNHVLASGVQEATWATFGAISAAERRKQLNVMGDFLRSLDPNEFPAIARRPTSSPTMTSPSSSQTASTSSSPGSASRWAGRPSVASDTDAALAVRR